MRFPTMVLFPLAATVARAKWQHTAAGAKLSVPHHIKSLTSVRRLLKMSSAAAVPAGREWGLQPVYTVLDLESPRVLLTVAREAIIPGRVGIRKDWKPLGLLRFTGKADVELRTGAITYGFSCKDNIIGGRFSVNVPDRLLEYRKKLRLPNGASIALSGGCRYVETGGPQLRDRFKPMLAVQVQLGDMGAGNAVWSGDGFDLKNRIPTPLLDYPKLEFEVYSSVKVPLLTARYSIQHGGTVGSLNSRRGPRGLSPQDENKPLHLHLSQTNLVFRF